MDAVTQVPTPVNEALLHEVHEREARLRATQGSASGR